MKGKDLATVTVGAGLLVWPAWWNGYPILIPDAIGYLSTARLVLPALQHPWSHQIPALRAEIYWAVMGLLHWDRSPWPLVGFGALVTSYIVWLAVRIMVPRTEICFLAIMVVLTAGTAIGWFVCAIQSDAMAPVTSLSLAILMILWERLSRLERWVVAALLWAGIEAHATHFMVAVAVCALLAIPMQGKWEWLPVKRSGWLVSVGVVVFAALSQMAMHRFLYGKATLNGEPPPYLMARVIADGPGKMYLQQHCTEHDWEICRHVSELPSTDTDFLWKIGGIYNSATDAQKKQLSAEQVPLALATLRTYPRGQVHQSLQNAWNQLTSIGVIDLAWPTPFVRESLDSVMPGGLARYLATRQANWRLHVAFFDPWFRLVAGAALVLTAVLLPIAWWKRRNVSAGFAVVVGLALALNAAVCGMLSGVYPRYETRVMWMLVLAAMLLTADALRDVARFSKSISGISEEANG